MTTLELTKTVPSRSLVTTVSTSTIVGTYHQFQSLVKTRPITTTVPSTSPTTIPTPSTTTIGT